MKNLDFLNHYQRELQFIREMGTEFARHHPKIAAGLDLGGTECADPYVERLLEGFAFLSARIQHKMDAEFPRFTQHLLEMVYPHYLAPLPSMTIVELQPDLSGGISEKGFPIPRQTRLLSSTVIKDRAKCEFRTAHDLQLWPLQITEASYLPLSAATRYIEPGVKGIKSALRLKLESIKEIALNRIPLTKLPFYLHGIGTLPSQIYELLSGHVINIYASPPDKKWREQLTSKPEALGFNDEEALLPYTAASFRGYRLLQEYFALPERFLFYALTDLAKAFRRCEGNTVEIVLLLNVSKPDLESLVSKDNFRLYCTPAINLFPKRADRIHLNNKTTEYPIIIDKTAQSDYELHSVTEVVGYGTGPANEQLFRPFYALQQSSLESSENFAYYTLHRKPALAKLLSITHKLKAPYHGNEVSISLVDSSSQPFKPDLKQLGVNTLCTNRDLPMLLSLGEGNTDFWLELSAPVIAIRSLAGPSAPKASQVESEFAWRLISHLSLNYLSLINSEIDTDKTMGAAALRELLMLYSDRSDVATQKQIEGLLNVYSKSVVMRIPVPGPMCFGRGLEITLEFEETAFTGSSCFLLAAVLERFFAKYVSINSYTQVVVKTRERGDIMRWPVRTGTRTLI